MKSSRSSFNTLLRKNITRFAPVWVLYTIGLVMVLLMMEGYETDYWRVSNMAYWVNAMAIINLGYALLTSLLLFGDLFNSRMCNALHAMPMKRDTWFAANVTSGMLFSLVPTAITTLAAVPFCVGTIVVSGWQVPFYWFAGANLSYVCFFGIAAFCVYLTGSRFAMTVVYGIVNFAAVICYWLIDTLYTPLLYGVETVAEPFLRLTPVVNLCNEEYLEVNRFNLDTPQYYGNFTVNTSQWGALLIWAAVGLALLGLALVLYKKRNLECAGDFLAFKKIEPVFLPVYTLIVGTCFQFFTSGVLGLYGDFGYLLVGLAIGWFTGLMLLNRTTRVFRKKTIGGCVLMILAVALSMTAAWLDVFGISSWMPEASEVKTAYVYLGYSYNDAIPEDAAVLTDREDIEKFLRVHELSLDLAAIEAEKQAYGEEPVYDDGYFTDDYTDSYFTYTLIYELEDGRTVRRYYHAYGLGEIGQIMTPWLSSTEVVLGVDASELEDFAEQVYIITIEGYDVALTDEQLMKLLDAIAGDCTEGHMAQQRSFHIGEPHDSFYIEFGWGASDRMSYWTNVRVYDCCEHVRAWIEENDLSGYLED